MKILGNRDEVQEVFKDEEDFVYYRYFVFGLGVLVEDCVFYVYYRDNVG